MQKIFSSALLKSKKKIYLIAQSIVKVNKKIDYQVASLKTCNSVGLPTALHLIL